MNLPAPALPHTTTTSFPAEPEVTPTSSPAEESMAYKSQLKELQCKGQDLRQTDQSQDFTHSHSTRHIAHSYRMLLNVSSLIDFD